MERAKGPAVCGLEMQSQKIIFPDNGIAGLDDFQCSWTSGPVVLEEDTGTNIAAGIILPFSRFKLGLGAPKVSGPKADLIGM